MKCVYLGILLLFSQFVFAQKGSSKLIQIINADNLEVEILGGVELQRLKGNVQIVHDGTYFYCDSAIHNASNNTFRAFGHAKADMRPQHTVLTSNEMEYDGNTKIGIATGNAVATDGKATLSSEKLTYFRNENYGQYLTGGKLENDNNTLTSLQGYYYPDKKMAYFKKNVHLKSPDYVLDTDTLGYNTQTATAIFLAPTQVTGADGAFTTSKGTYETKSKKLNLESRTKMNNKDYIMVADNSNYDDQSGYATMTGTVEIMQKDTSFTLYADTVHYNRTTEVGDAQGNITMIQEDSSMIIKSRTADFSKKNNTATAYQDVWIQQKDSAYTITADTATYNNKTKRGVARNRVTITQKDSTLKIYGNYALFIKDTLTQTTETWMTRNPISVQKMEDDTMYVTADTLYAREDSAKRRVFRAYNHVNIFMKELKGKSDSMVYRYSDSMIVLYKKPILWTDSSQLTGDTIAIWMKNKKIDSLWVSGNAFLASRADTVGFNQIKGKEFRAKFVNNKLHRLQVIGNSESLYYIEDEKKGYQGLNKSISQEMTIYLKDNKAVKIYFKAKPEGTYSPIHEVIFEKQELEGMEWREKEKPEKPTVPIVQVRS